MEDSSPDYLEESSQERSQFVCDLTHEVVVKFSYLLFYFFAGSPAFLCGEDMALTHSRSPRLPHYRFLRHLVKGFLLL